MTEKIEDYINKSIQAEGVNTNLISDGYHTFGELYEHRIELWVQYCRLMVAMGTTLQARAYIDVEVWRSKLHSDGSSFDGWFVLGIGKDAGDQMTYHLPMKHWERCEFAETLERAPEFDGHTSADVLKRLAAL